MESEDKQKLRVFCEGLEVNDIETFLEEDPEIIRNFGALMARYIKEYVADANRLEWLLNGHGYFMEEEGLCGHTPWSQKEKDHARRKIDEAMEKDGYTDNA